MFSFKSKKKEEQVAKGYVSVHFAKQGIAIAYRTNTSSDMVKPKIQLCQYIPCASEKELAAKLRNFVHEHHLQRVPVNFVLKPEDYRLLYIDSPRVAAEELANASRYLIKDLINFPLNEAVVDAFVVPARPGQKEKIHVVVAEVKLIEKLVNIIEDSGLKLNCIDIPELAMANMLRFLEQQQAKTIKNEDETQAATLMGTTQEAAPEPEEKAPQQTTPEEKAPQQVAPPAPLMEENKAPLANMLPKREEKDTGEEKKDGGNNAPLASALSKETEADSQAPLASSLPRQQAAATNEDKADSGGVQANTSLAETMQATTDQAAKPSSKATSKNIETGLMLLEPGFSEIIVSRESLLCLARDVETDLSFIDKSTDASDKLSSEVLQQVTAEVERSVSYYQSHLSRGQMQDFWVLTMLEDQDALINSLQNVLAADVKPLDLNEKLLLSTPLERVEQAQCLPAIGGVLRDLGGDA